MQPPLFQAAAAGTSPAAAETSAWRYRAGSHHVPTTVKRWMATFADQPSCIICCSAGRLRGHDERKPYKDVIGEQREAESFEAAAAASVPERMATACIGMPASSAPLLGTQTTWTAWSGLIRHAAAAVLQCLQDEA